MRVNWVFADTYQLDPSVNVERLKSIGPMWGSWRTWRSCSTDNVVCHDFKKCQDLMQHAFQAVCNFYIPKKFYQDLARPMGLKLYDGEYTEAMNNIEDIVSLHLVSDSDIVLLMGFDFGKLEVPVDQFEQHKLKNYHGLVRSTIVANPNTQWVAVDHPHKFDLAYQNLPNLTCDSLENVLKLLM